jgi:hypothetical protein
MHVGMIAHALPHSKDSKHMPGTRPNTYSKTSLHCLAAITTSIRLVHDNTHAHMHTSPRSNHSDHTPCTSPDTHPYTCMHRLAPMTMCICLIHAAHIQTYMHGLAWMNVSMCLIHAHKHTHTRTHIRALSGSNNCKHTPHLCKKHEGTYFRNSVKTPEFKFLFMHAHTHTYAWTRKNEGQNVPCSITHIHTWPLHIGCVHASTYMHSTWDRVWWHMRVWHLVPAPTCACMCIESFRSVLTHKMWALMVAIKVWMPLCYVHMKALLCLCTCLFT